MKIRSETELLQQPTAPASHMYCWDSGIAPPPEVIISARPGGIAEKVLRCIASPPQQLENERTFDVVDEIRWYGSAYSIDDNTRAIIVGLTLEPLDCDNLNIPEIHLEDVKDCDRWSLKPIREQGSAVTLAIGADVSSIPRIANAIFACWVLRRDCDTKTTAPYGRKSSTGRPNKYGSHYKILRRMK